MNSVGRLLLHTLVTLAVSGCLATARERSHREDFYAGSLAVPDGVKLRLDPNRYPDFYMYDIKTDEKDILGIYVGNAANPRNFQYETIRIGTCVATSSMRVAGEAVDRDTIIAFEDDDFPTMVHFFYRDLPKAAAEQADAIIGTFRPSHGRTCSLRGTPPSAR